MYDVTLYCSRDFWQSIRDYVRAWRGGKYYQVSGVDANTVAITLYGETKADALEYRDYVKVIDC